MCNASLPPQRQERRFLRRSKNSLNYLKPIFSLMIWITEGTFMEPNSIANKAGHRHQVVLLQELGVIQEIAYEPNFSTDS